MLLGTTGLRLGEALGLRWEAVDLDAGTLKVKLALQRTKQGLVLQEPKSASSRRTIELTPRAVTALREHRSRQLEARLAADPAWIGHGLVFTTGFGTPLDQQRVHQHWTKAIEGAGIPRHRLHDLRHAIASHLMASGLNALEVAAVLGHSDAGLVLKVYGHAAPTAPGKAAAMAAMLG